MTCKDCIHYNVCNMYDGPYISVHLEHTCEYFTDSSEWVHLPCKKGDKVYYIYQDPTTCKYSIRKREIYLIEFNNNHFYFYATPSICFKDTEFGKSVFLTREEAEKALIIEECRHGNKISITIDKDNIDKFDAIEINGIQFVKEDN